MDPNETLKRMLELAEAIVEQGEEEEGLHTLATQEERAAELAEAVLALNDWIKRGGFLPERWATKVPTAAQARSAASPTRLAAAAAMRQLRLRLGLTQEEVARLAGCSRVTVNKTEGGYPASRLVRRSIWQALEQAAIEAEIKTEEASEKDLADLPDLG